MTFHIFAGFIKEEYEFIVVQDIIWQDVRLDLNLSSKPNNPTAWEHPNCYWMVLE